LGPPYGHLAAWARGLLLLPFLFGVLATGQAPRRHRLFADNVTTGSLRHVKALPWWWMVLPAGDFRAATICLIRPARKNALVYRAGAGCFGMADGGNLRRRAVVGARHRCGIFAIMSRHKMIPLLPDDLSGLACTSDPLEMNDTEPCCCARRFRQMVSWLARGCDPVR